MRQLRYACVKARKFTAWERERALKGVMTQ